MKTVVLFAAVFLLVSEALILRKPTKPRVEVENGYKTYSGYSVIRVIPHTVDQIKAVVEMEQHLGFEPDFWKPPKALRKSIDIMISPDKRAEVTIYLKKAGLVPIIKIADVGKHVAVDKVDIDGYQPNQNLATDPDSFDFYKYHPFTEIMSYIEAVATKYSSFVSIASLGKSLEGRDMKYLKIGYPSQSKKNALFIDAGIHAREWIAPATALYTINQLVTNSSYTDLLKAIDIYIAPSINPDDRMWRKSRSGPRQGCYGADINRNFAYKWMVSGASTNPCSETYAGPSAMSEIEAKNLANFIVPHNDTIKAYLTLHSYGEDIVYPWGYTTGTYPPDVADLKALGREMYNAIIAIHGTQYLVGNSGDALYPAAGASDDYSKSVGVKYVYTVELRPGDGDNDDDDWYGFELPAKFIKPTAEEAFPGLLAAANRVQNGPF
uniref:Peptidase M14 carboxypeptidase A domain-containing protein n=1 Tax=Panagrolaimus sp. JU765 TaxID=591449 RepID=A0AC34RCH7_9BILA